MYEIKRGISNYIIHCRFKEKITKLSRIELHKTEADIYNVKEY